MANLVGTCSKIKENMTRIHLIPLIASIILGVVTTACGGATDSPSVSEPQEEEEAKEPETLDCRTEDDVLVCEEEGVTIKAPWQGYEVEVEKLELGILEELDYEQTDEHQPIRLVIHFRVINAESEEKEIVENFEPPLELEVSFTGEDVERAGGLKNLTLGFLDRDDGGGKWVALETGLEGGEDGGIGFANITSWYNRHTAWLSIVR